MDFYVYFCVCLLYLQIVASHETQDRCSYTDTRSEINLAPIVKRALTLDEFDAHVAGKRMAQFYRGRAGQTSDRKYNAYFTKTAEGIYVKRGEWDNGSGCVLSEEEVHEHVDMQMCKRRHVKKATLFFQDSDEFTVFLSDCPMSYVVMIECDPVEPEAVTMLKTCPIEDTQISVFLPNIPAGEPIDDVLLYQIAKYLYNTTGIKIGALNWTWTFTFGDECEGK